MTAIAWALIFISLIYYERLYIVEIKAAALSEFVGGFTLFSLIVLMICTLRELLR